MPCEHPRIFEEPLELCSGTAFTENCILKSKLEILNYSKLTCKYDSLLIPATSADSYLGKSLSAHAKEIDI